MKNIFSVIARMHRTFVYGTLKREGLNNYLLLDSNNGKAEFVCEATTVEKFPLVIATEANIPFLLYVPGDGNVSYICFITTCMV